MRRTQKAAVGAVGVGCWVGCGKLHLPLKWVADSVLSFSLTAALSAANVPHLLSKLDRGSEPAWFCRLLGCIVHFDGLRDGLVRTIAADPELKRLLVLARLVIERMLIARILGSLRTRPCFRRGMQ